MPKSSERWGYKMMVKTSDFRSARRFNYSWQDIDHPVRTDVPARKFCGWGGRLWLARFLAAGWAGVRQCKYNPTWFWLEKDFLEGGSVNNE